MTSVPDRSLAAARRVSTDPARYVRARKRTILDRHGKPGWYEWTLRELARTLFGIGILALLVFVPLQMKLSWLPSDAPPTGYGDLSAWLTELTGSGAPAVRRAEKAGRRIGRDIAPRAAEAPAAETLQSTLAALGFGPELDARRHGGVSYRLGNCPYRKAVEQNPEVVCALHRGLTEGLLEVIAPGARLTDFRPKDPCDAGCLLEIDGLDHD